VAGNNLDLAPEAVVALAENNFDRLRIARHDASCARARDAQGSKFVLKQSLHGIMIPHLRTTRQSQDVPFGNTIRVAPTAKRGSFARPVQFRCHRPEAHHRRLKAFGDLTGRRQQIRTVESVAIEPKDVEVELVAPQQGADTLGARRRRPSDTRAAARLEEGQRRFVTADAR
jgi:hypothetical protein